MTDTKVEMSTAFADAFYSGAQIVAGYMKERSDMIQSVLPKPTTGFRDAALQGLWLRALAWMQSLERLNHTKYFQAISAGNRALLEITVDVILLHCDKTNGPGWKMFEWARSEKLKAAASVVSFFATAGLPVPDSFTPSVEFYKNEKASIERTRQTLWGKIDHPRRWTGRSDLSRDVEEADRLYGSVLKDDLDVTLTEYYRTEYRQMNWQIHSGVAGFGNIPPEGFDIISAMSLKWCADLAMLCTKVVLSDFGFGTALPALGQEWDNIKLQRGPAYMQKMHPENKSGKP